VVVGLGPNVEAGVNVAAFHTFGTTGVLNAGYSLGNDSYHGNDNRFVFVYYGVTF